MDQEHWSFWGCPLCPSARFDTSPELSDHTSLQHTDEVPVGSREVFVRLCRTTSLERVGALCPLCSVFKARTLDQYQIHIVGHLEQAARSAFPEILDEAENLKHLAQDSKNSLVMPQGQSGDIRTSFANLSIHEVEPASNTPEKVAPETTVPILQPDTASSSSSQHPQPDNPSLNPQAVSSSGGKSSSPNESPSTHPPQWQHPSSTMEAHRFKGSDGKTKVIYLRSCGYCGHAGMNVHTTPACTECGLPRH